PAGADRPHAVEHVSFDLHAGRILCVVGDSGSGKSVCAQALMGLLPPQIGRAGGEIRFEDHNLLALDAEGWRNLRGRRIAMIFQE
ncbi:ATP-binding cassette domain-containing protein, partial [Acinetobacter baumannii]